MVCGCVLSLFLSRGYRIDALRKMDCWRLFQDWLKATCSFRDSSKRGPRSLGWYGCDVMHGGCGCQKEGGIAAGLQKRARPEPRSVQRNKQCRGVVVMMGEKGRRYYGMDGMDGMKKEGEAQLWILD